MSSGHDFLPAGVVTVASGRGRVVSPDDDATRVASAYAEPIGSHYDVLGVSRDASSPAIRTAYRERARRHHPDRAVDDDTAMMAALNEAYRVLGDPGRRALYDRSLDDRSASTTDVDGADGEADPAWSTPGAVSRPSALAPAGPARVPWKLMVVTAVIGSAAVLIGSAFNDPPSEEPPDGILRAGSCVAIESNGDAREIACSGVDDVVVDLLIPTGAVCPTGMASHRDRLGLGTACIELD